MGAGDFLFILAFKNQILNAPAVLCVCVCSLLLLWSDYAARHVSCFYQGSAWGPAIFFAFSVFIT